MPIVPDPVNAPKEKSLLFIPFPLTDQNSMVPGAALLVATVVVTVAPSLLVLVDGFRESVAPGGSLASP